MSTLGDAISEQTVQKEEIKMGMGKSRRFDGKVYHHHLFTRTKTTARERAKGLRSRGYLVRIVKTPKTLVGKNPKMRWMVYVNSSKRRTPKKKWY